MAVASTAVCLVIFSPKGGAVRCVSSKKAIEKAKAEVKKMPGYKTKEMSKSRCPVCFPPPPIEDEEAYTAHVAMVEDEEKSWPGNCHECKASRHGIFRLKIIDHVLVRICKDCNAHYDLDKLKPWEGVTHVTT